MGEASPWTLRSYVDDDENCVVSMWLRSFSRSRYVASWLAQRGLDPEMPRRWFLRTTTPEERHEQEYYRAFFRPMILGLLAGAETRVLCDAERAYTTPERPSLIYAWACLGPGRVHYVCVKQDAIRAGEDIAADIVATLLGDRLEEAQVTTWEPRELSRMGLLPASWRHDPEWLDLMRLVQVRARRQGERAATAAALSEIAIDLRMLLGMSKEAA